MAGKRGGQEAGSEEKASCFCGVGWGGVCVCVFPVAQGNWFESAPTVGVFLQDDTPVTQAVPLHRLGQVCSFSPIVSVPGETNSGVHTNCSSCFILIKSLTHAVPPNF